MTRIPNWVLLAALALIPGIAIAQINADDLVRDLNRPGSDTRGIRHGGPTSQPAPGTRVSMPRPRARTRPAVGCSYAALPSGAANTQAVQLMITFVTGSASVTPSAGACLDELGKALSSSTLLGFRFQIAGHTDNVGTPEQNAALSLARAGAVVAYLADRHNIALSRLAPAGYGQDRPLIATAPQTSERRNRRVEVINLGN